ncbi:SDR family oxidoreductase [Spirosoma sp. KNUC1025]|uniref:SDR family oxidoreductase n=1 Tax=Spirosoma sp. KNUC1025 TaxID=2894082 RepID=UPI001E4EAD77|nr:SDR family oxidoreductase [Spirosoma sp. KNUC1025]UFH57673.1 SDR family oxidoreductase [Spirosoma sp. KNUC1025]
MKIVIIGGTGMIGSKLTAKLHSLGFDAIAAAPETGVNTVTGEGLATALERAQVVVDVSNYPSFEAGVAQNFFETSGRNLQAAESVAGVRHHILLTIVGTERMPDNVYYRAKVAQENIVKSGSIPFTILHATQFYEFASSFLYTSNKDQSIPLPPALMQPIAADDVVATLADLAVSEPLNAAIEVAGPEKIPMDEFVRRYLNAIGDSHKVITDESAGFFGTVVNDSSLTPGDNPRIGHILYEDWLRAMTQSQQSSAIH